MPESKREIIANVPRLQPVTWIVHRLAAAWLVRSGPELHLTSRGLAYSGDARAAISILPDSVPRPCSSSGPEERGAGRRAQQESPKGLNAAATRGVDRVEVYEGPYSEVTVPPPGGRC